MFSWGVLDKRSGLSKPQFEVVKTFDRWDNCRIVREAGPKDRYELQFWQDGGKIRTSPLNSRTVRALIQQEALIKADEYVYILAPEWGGKKG